MRTVLLAIAVLALEILLIWGYFTMVGMGQMFSATVALALLLGAASVLAWLGFDSGFGQALKRLLLAVVGCVIVTYSALVVVALVDLRTAVVCERGRTEVEATPTSWADASKNTVWGLVSTSTPRAAWAAGTDAREA